MTKKTITLILTILIIISFPVFSAGNRETPDNDSSAGKLPIFVSILPQTYFVETIGGERVTVDVMVPPGRSPATYEPTPVQMAKLSSAEIFFTVGLPFENAFLPKVRASLKSLEIVDTGKGITRRAIEEHGHEEEDEHGHEGEEPQDEDEHEDEHEHEGDDPHIWLSPVLAKTQAQNIHDALAAADPEGSEIYTAGLNKLLAELDAVHAQIKKELAPYEGRIFFIFHPTLGYFADEYGLEQVAIESGGKEPSPAELSEIIEHAREEDVKIIFVQPEFSEETAAVIAEAIDGNVVKINPLNPDYISSLSEIASKIRQSYEQ